jgi:formylglycine-generating enzyme required for sulfatase activity
MLKILFLLGLFLTSSTAFGGSADFDGSGTIDFNDFLLFGRSVGTNPGNPKYSPAYDLDADQSIGFPDFRLFAASFGNAVLFPPVGSHHEMVPIPEGHFLMGTESGNSTMRPAHTVYLNAFLMDRFEVTNGRFLAFLNKKGGV